MSLWDVYIGTFTAEFRNSRGQQMGRPSRGIERFRFDDADGALSFVDSVSDVVSPSFLALHPRLPVLYAVERRLDLLDDNVGALSCFSVDETGALTSRTKVSSAGASPSHLSVHPTGSHAYVVNYLSGEIASFPLDGDGTVRPADVVLRHSARTSSNPRQQAPHPHQIRPLENGRWVVFTDLGLDALFAYRTSDDGAIVRDESRRVALPDGSGPRHMAIHRSGEFIYVLGELDSTLNIVAANDGVPLRLLATHSTRRPGNQEHSAPSEIVVHPDMRSLYVANRYSDNIAQFALSDSGDTAELIGHEPCLGQIPRNISLDPTGSFLIVANQSPGSLAVFAIGDDRRLRPVGSPVEARTPSCVLFAQQSVVEPALPQGR